MNTVVPFRVLIVKMSSLGDVIHTLPSLSDAAKAHPNIQFDWVIEEGFAEIPAWHPRVDRVIPVALRRWKKDWKKAWSSGEFPRFLKALRARRYDLIIDPQGLLKSGLITLLAKGPVYGYDRASLKEGIARLFYRRGFSVARDLHAVLRMRLLFSKALKYEFEPEAYEYGLLIPESTFAPQGKYVLLMHGTTWVTKHWPEAYWIDLANKVREAAFPVYLSFGNEVEKARAERIAKASGAQVLPKLKLSEMARVIQGAYAIV
ncbi:MAG: lipopolysaccharide heptosyltransferase I, partial [Gammaproteobacteria bacterium]|nr:lipopolysaccharide heptosyltransferase I [Gammaproteobacteria bacterium]